MPIRLSKTFCRIVVLVVTVGIVGPPRCAEAGGRPEFGGIIARSVKPSLIADVVLGENGALHGAVVNAAGQPQVGRGVDVVQADGKKISTVTNADGNFVVSSLKGGVYQIATGERSIICRIWSAESAPPVAVSGLILVSDARIHRGQREFGSLLCSDKVLLALVLAGAIAIPIAITSNDDDAS